MKEKEFLITSFKASYCLLVRFGPPAGAPTQTKYGVYKENTTQKVTRKWTGMRPDENFGKQPASSKSNYDHAVFQGQDGSHQCMGCRHHHQSETKQKSNKRPEFNGRQMAKGDIWRYSDLKKPINNTMRTNMTSTEAPEFITRISTPVPARDFGHKHPFTEGTHTERLRDASVQKGCGKKCTWQKTASSSDSPFSQGSDSKPKSVYAQPYRGTGRNGKNPNQSPRPDLRAPFAVSVLQHPNDFNKSSTKHQLGKQSTNRFYNAIGGWSASRG